MAESLVEAEGLAEEAIINIPISSINDFPVICGDYKQTFIELNSHIVIGARIIAKTTIDELAQSIKRDGLYHPVIVRETGSLAEAMKIHLNCLAETSNVYQMISGHLRKYAFKKLAKETIPAKIIKVDDLEAKSMLITTNRFQHPLEQIEEAWVVEDMIKNHKKSLKECAVILDASKSWVYHRYLLATKLIKEIQLDIVMGLISPRSASEIATVHAREQLKLSETIKKHKLSFRESHELIKIIKNKDISDRIKELSFDDPRAAIKSIYSNKVITYDSASTRPSANKMSYFANNFRKEVNRLSVVSLEIIHRIRRDFRRFSEYEQSELLKDLSIINKRINELSKLLKAEGLAEDIKING